MSPSAGTRPKYVPLRPDQWGDLDAVARELQDAKGNRATERITANTLIRVGIDFLLGHHGALAGDTEEELLASLRAAVERPAT